MQIQQQRLIDGRRQRARNIYVAFTFFLQTQHAQQVGPAHHRLVPVVEVDDEVFFVAAAQNIPAVMKELRRAEKRFRRLIFAGGGNIGRRLAAAMEGDYRVKVIEQDQKRARLISEELEKTIVLCGDAADENLLLEENIENTDVFCALTNDEGFGRIFVEQLRNFARPGDVVMVLSVSGNSENILKAVEYARQCRATTVGFLGSAGGRALVRAGCFLGPLALAPKAQKPPWPASSLSSAVRRDAAAWLIVFQGDCSVPAFSSFARA